MMLDPSPMPLAAELVPGSGAVCVKVDSDSARDMHRALVSGRHDPVTARCGFFVIKNTNAALNNEYSSLYEAYRNPAQLGDTCMRLWEGYTTLRRYIQWRPVEVHTVLKSPLVDPQTDITMRVATQEMCLWEPEDRDHAAALRSKLGEAENGPRLTAPWRSATRPSVETTDGRLMWNVQEADDDCLDKQPAACLHLLDLYDLRQAAMDAGQPPPAVEVLPFENTLSLHVYSGGLGKPTVQPWCWRRGHGRECMCRGLLRTLLGGGPMRWTFSNGLTYEQRPGTTVVTMPQCGVVTLESLQPTLSLHSTWAWPTAGAAAPAPAGAAGPSGGPSR